MKIESIVNDSEVLYTSDEIKVVISNIADTINEYFKDIKDSVTILPVMKGAIPFAGYLIPQLSFNTNIE
jgi:hypoxanthine-guanine phosphoribosyltransferase